MHTCEGASTVMAYRVTQTGTVVVVVVTVVMIAFAAVVVTVAMGNRGVRVMVVSIMGGCNASFL